MEVGDRQRYIHKDESDGGGASIRWTLVVLCGVYFFCLLSGYFLLRPIREGMGVQRGMADLRWLFLVTCGVSLVVTVAFGGVVSRLDRRRFLAIAQRVVVVCVLAFAFVRWRAGGEPGVWVGYVFYVWLSVVNLFLMSLFWGFMADIWSLAHAKRLFPVIGVGGTLGAIFGATLAWTMAERIGVVWQLVFAAGMFEISSWVMAVIDRRSDSGAARVDNRRAPVGGRFRDGLIAVFGSPYLLGIGAYIALMAVSSTLVYFTGANIVVDAEEELESRIGLFAQLDLWTQVATLLVQLFVTGQIIKRLGVGVALCAMPIVTVAGFAVLAWVSGMGGVEGWQIFAVFAVFNAVHRATRYAVIRPARETLFSVVSTGEKYKAKPIVDVFLYRGGDVAGTGVERLIAGAGIGLMGMVFAAVPLAVLWGGLGIALAWMQRRKAPAVGEGEGSSGIYSMQSGNAGERI
ncbi:MAG: hypothetical protein KC996_03645 [Phycisphaerales bacterium]|nr:hypothetical protein [Phycisphaerales bacterium]